MRRSFIAVALTTMLAATASANPNPAPTPPQPETQTFEMSFTAGPGRLGIAALKIGAELRAHLGAPADRGVLVDSVRKDGVAAKAGVRVGDIVIAVDGKPVRSASDVIDAMTDRKKGDEVAIEVVRGRAKTQLSAKLDRDAPTGPMFDQRDMQRWMQEWPHMGYGADRGVEKILQDIRQRLERLEQRTDSKPLDGPSRQRT